MKFFNHFIHGALLLTMFFCIKPMDNSINNNEVTIKNKFEVPLPHTKLYFLSNKYLLGIGIRSYNIFLWNLKKDKIDKKFPFSITNTFSEIMALSKDKNLIAVGLSYQRKIELFNTKKWQFIKSLESTDPSTAMAFSPINKNLLATTGYLNKITFLNIITGKIIKEIENIHNRAADVLKFSPDGKKIVTSSLGKIKIWNVESHVLQNSLDFCSIENIKFLPDNKTVVITDYHYSKITLWDTEIQKLTAYRASLINRNNKNSILIHKKEGIFDISLEKTINIQNRELTALANSKKYIAISGDNCFVTVLKLSENIKNYQNAPSKEEQL